MSTTTRRSRFAAAVAVLAVAASPWAVHAAGTDDPLRLETGHIDAFHLTLNDDSTVHLNLAESTTGTHVEHDPESVELFVKDDAYLTDLPPASLPPGAPTSLYYLPISQDQNLIWPGWDSEGVSSYYGNDASVDIVISAVDGPGQVYLWSTGAFGDVRQVLVDGYTLPDTIHQDFPTHGHASWGFTASGVYRLTAQATVTSSDATRTSTSNTAVYTFVVGSGTDLDPTGPTLTILDVPAHYHTGAVATLTAVQTPAGTSDHVHWFTRTSADGEWEAVKGALTDTHGFVVTAEHQVKAVIYDAAHRVVAETDPVDIRIDDHGSTPVVGPTLRANLPEAEGALVVSVADGSTDVRLSDLTLDAHADRYVSTGTIEGITVTDTRSQRPGWSATGRVRGLVTVDGGTIDGTCLGWTPTVLSSAADQSVTPGAAVAPGLAGGDGIKSWSALGSAAAGSAPGVAVLGADVRIEAPLTTQVGDYSGVVLVTVV